MKKYKKLLSFGCSYTEGGLTLLKVRQFLDNKPNKFYTNDELKQLSNRDSYPSCLAKLLDCEVKNYGTSCASNEYILGNVYDVISSLENTDDILVTIQTSHLSRILIQLPEINSFVNVNNCDNLDKDIDKFYEMYATRFFSINYSFKKLLRDIDLLNTWIKQKNIDVLWMLTEIHNEFYPQGKEFVNFDGKSMGSYTADNKLLLIHLPNFPLEDRHYSPQGNQIIADKIYTHLKNNYD